ncbi:MAG: NAD(P)H-hydrate dehydratase [Hyphomicrobiaceae bacterium]
MDGDDLTLLTADEMGRADRLAIEAGVPSRTLMENAGIAVADVAAEMVNYNELIVVLCGPGNNGGDGFVAARHLKERGFNVRLCLYGDRARLSGDAKAMAVLWRGAIEPLILHRQRELQKHTASEAHRIKDKVINAHDDPNFKSLPYSDDRAVLYVDALFGTGLRAGDEGLSAIIRALNEVAVNRNAQRRVSILAVDLPSGIDGTSGRSLGTGSGEVGECVRADQTVTFFRAKTGHVLFPGRQASGRVRVRDIAISDEILATVDAKTWRNAPLLWSKFWPSPPVVGHKYSRGHAVVLSGAAHATGAARLGARAALRVGAGLVTVASPKDAVSVNAAHLTSIMIGPLSRDDGLAEILKDPRKNAVLIGPGAGVTEATEINVSAALALERAVVLDADALTVFTGKSSALWQAIRARSANAGGVVLTPHEGEYARLFGPTSDCKLDRARQAARKAGAVVVLKGPDTVIAAPDGRATINCNAPPELATAGSGDVLAGLIAGLLAQQMPAWQAASAAVWLHGVCAEYLGPGLIAEDIPDCIPRVLRQIREILAPANQFCD